MAFLPLLASAIAAPPGGGVIIPIPTPNHWVLATSDDFSAGTTSNTEVYTNGTVSLTLTGDGYAPSDTQTIAAGNSTISYYYPDIAVDSTGRRIIAYTRMDSSGHAYVYMRGVSKDGTIEPDAKLISSSSASALPVVAVMPGNNVVAAWVDVATNMTYAQILDTNFNPVSARITVANYYTDSVDIAALPSGQFMIVLDSNFDPRLDVTTDIYSRVYNADGSLACAQYVASSTSGVGLPHVTAGGDSFFVTWVVVSGTHPLNDDIYASIYDTSCSATSYFAVATGPVDQEFYDAAWVPSDGEFVVAWNERPSLDPFYNIYANYYDTSGSLASSQTPFTSLRYASTVQVTAAPSGHVILLFNETDGQVFKPDGTTLSPVLGFKIYDGDTGSTVLAPDPRGGFAQAFICVPQGTYYISVCYSDIEPQFVSSGTYTSPPFNAGMVKQFTNFSWQKYGNVALDYQASNSSSFTGASWVSVSGPAGRDLALSGASLLGYIPVIPVLGLSDNGTVNINKAGRYFRYRATLTRGSPAYLYETDLGYGTVPSPTPTPTPAASPTATPAATPTPTPEANATITPTPESSPTETPAATPTATPQTSPTVTPTPAATGTPNPAQSCIASGGHLSSSLCCGSVGDYPNTCLIGGCGCAPWDSHTVATCECGNEKCFDGTACVPMGFGPTPEITPEVSPTPSASETPSPVGTATPAITATPSPTPPSPDNTMLYAAIGVIVLLLLIIIIGGGLVLLGGIGGVAYFIGRMMGGNPKPEVPKEEKPKKQKPERKKPEA